MRTFPPFRLLTLALLTTVLVCALRADDSVVHLPEDASAAQTLSDLRELLRLSPTEHVRLEEGEHALFRIDDDRLVLAPGARLDYESRSQHDLSVQIFAEAGAKTVRRDPLQRRFRALVNNQPGSKQPSAVRSVTLRILVDDVPEPPLLLGSRFRSVPGAPPRPGQRIGRAIAIDLDHDERHHFELLEGGAYVRIDPDSGEVFLRDDFNPQSLAVLQALVRVTDRSGLSASTTYGVWLNDSPPAPPLPVLLADTSRPARDFAPKHSASIVEASPAAKGHAAATATGEETETAANSENDSQQAGLPHVASAAPIAPPRSTRASEPSWLQEQLATIDLGTVREHGSQWLTVAAVTMCVVVIILSGVQSAVLAGRQPVDRQTRTSTATTPPAEQTPRRPVERDPREISEILERLDAVIGQTDGSAGNVESAAADEIVESPAPAGDPVPRKVRVQAGSGATADEAAGGTATVPGAPVTPGPVAAAGTTVAVSASASASTGTSSIADDERERIEQFREISRMMNRADIGRHSRERMRDEWLSVGVTSLACVVTGSVCVFSNCVGAMSIPLGSALFSVASVLLLRPSLYPQVPGADATRSHSRDRRRQRAE